VRVDALNETYYRNKVLLLYINNIGNEIWLNAKITCFGAWNIFRDHSSGQQEELWKIIILRWFLRFFRLSPRAPEVFPVGGGTEAGSQHTELTNQAAWPFPRV